MIYQGQNLTKPLKIIELTEEMIVQEVRKADIGGKQYVFKIKASPSEPEEFFAASTESMQEKWIRAITNIKDQFV